MGLRVCLIAFAVLGMGPASPVIRVQAQENLDDIPVTQ